MKITYLNYVFDASAKTIVFSDYTSGSLTKEMLFIITNVEDGIMIYNFADPAKGGTITPDVGGDILTLEYDTTSMDDADKLQIIIDDLNLPAKNDVLLSINDSFPGSTGQKTMAGSLGVVIASNQSAIPVDGSGVTQPVSAASLPLPTGAATEAKQDDAITQLTSIAGEDFATQTTLALVKAKTDNLDIALSALRDASIAAGDNNIGNVDVVTVPSDPFGANADAAVAAGAAGSIQAKLRRLTQGVEDLKTTIVLAAGSAAIGKLAANDGVDIGDVTLNNASIAVTQSGTWDEVGINDSGNSITVDAPVGTPVFTRLSDGSAALIGQKAMAASIPVVLASDQSAITVSSHAVTNAGTFAVQDSEKIADNGGFTDGTTKVMPTGYIYDEVAGTALTENDIAAARINVNRAQVNAIEDGATRGRYATVTAANALKVDASGMAVPVTDNSGSLTVDAPVGTPVFTTITPSATGGWDTFMATSADGSTALTNSAQAIKASAGTFGGYYIYNPNSSAVYVHIYNTASGSVTVGTTNPKNTFCIPATSGANLEITNGIQYGTAMSCAATTTGPGNTAPSTALECNFFFK